MGWSVVSFSVLWGGETWNILTWLSWVWNGTGLGSNLLDRMSFSGEWNFWVSTAWCCLCRQDVTRSWFRANVRCLVRLLPSSKRNGRGDFSCANSRAGCLKTHLNTLLRARYMVHDRVAFCPMSIPCQYIYIYVFDRMHKIACQQF